MRIREAIYIFIALLAVASALWVWYHPQKEFVPFEKVVLQSVPGETIYKLKECRVESDKPIVPIASGVIPKAPEGGEVVTTLTPSSGEVSISFTPSRRKLFDFVDEKRIGGIIATTGGLVYANWTFARVGEFHLSLGGAGWVNNSESGGLVGLGVEYRF